MTEPTDDLQQRCAEIVEWQRTGVLPGDALRNYAAAHWDGHTDALQMAERDTSAQAMQWIAEFGTPPSGAGEPVAYLHKHKHSGMVELSLRRMADNDFNRARWECSPLYAAPATPQPTQAQAGAPRVSPEQWQALFDDQKRLVELANSRADIAESLLKAVQAQAGAVPLMYLPPLITAQINHLRNTAYRDGADGEPTGLLDKVHERLGAIILTELNKARQQSTPAHGIKGGQHGADT